jgi:hypothetical protein
MMLLASAGGSAVPVIARLVQADEDTVRDVIHRFNEIGLACRSEEVHLSSPAFRFALIRRPVPLGAANAWTAPETEDFGAISKALPLCVCTPGFIGEDLL